MNNTGSEKNNLNNDQKHQEYINRADKTMKKSEQIFMIITVVIAGVFIFFLPDIYKFFSNLNIPELFNSKPTVVEKEEEKEEEKQPVEEVKYKAVTCTKTEMGEEIYLNTTTLYFSSGKLKKMNLVSTYDYKDGYIKEKLNDFFLQQQNKLSAQKGFEMKIDSTDDQIYSVNYSVDLAVASNDVLIEIPVNDRLDSAEKATIDLYQSNGFVCQ